ncbi:putative quinol monooxygenase [Flexivirga alba]|uniref:Quinol monooxygenase n=1 Tax=Flexivirga alba TaxID=702742 RepID=A0ABW2AD96_9MICO
MTDIAVTAIITAKPGSESAVQAALTALVEPTRAEPGCVDYQLAVSSVDPAVFITTERWRTSSDVEAHLETEHVKTALDTAGEHLAVPPAIHPLTPLA